MTEKNRKTFRQRFIDVDDNEINLKFLFEHIKNYLVCATVFFSAIYVISASETVIGIPGFGVISGSILCLIAVGLFGLNLLQGMHAVIVFFKLKFALPIYLVLVLFFSTFTFGFWELLVSDFACRMR